MDERMKLADKIMSADLQWVRDGLWLTDDESMMIAAALRAPEAADAGAATPLRWMRWSNEHREWIYSATDPSKPIAGGYTGAIPLYASPTAAGIAAPPEGTAERWYVHYDGFGDYFKSNEPKGHVALCYDEDFADQIVAMLDAAPPTASADAVREQIAQAIMAYRPAHNMPAHELLVMAETQTALAAVVRALTAPVAGADAGMRERAALKVAEAALADIGDAERKPGDDLAWCEARAAEALPCVRAALSPDAGLGMVGREVEILRGAAEVMREEADRQFDSTQARKYRKLADKFDADALSQRPNTGGEASSQAILDNSTKYS